MRKPIIAGNWKMNLKVSEGLELAREIRNRASRFRDVEVVLAPPATSLYPILQSLKESRIAVAAQNCHFEQKGAFTGELSPLHLKDIGCQYCIIGHSERRQLFGESDEGVAKKARALLDLGLIPIICMGETLEQREAGITLDVIKGQLKAGLSLLEPSEVTRCVLAYEPIWAIGTGRTASPAQAQEVHAAIRGELSELFGEQVSQQLRIQYGGSVKPQNVRALMAQPDIDGALVGGASLKADSFVQLVAFKEDD